MGEIDYKVDAAYDRNLGAILVPLGNRAVLDESVLVPRAITQEIVHYVSDLDAALPHVFGAIESL